MFAKERQDQIYELIQKQGNVIVSDLVERFQVSIETIRRDLLCMEENGLLVRVHGGAVAASEMKIYNSLPQRKQEHSDQKRELARLAAEFVREGDYIGIDTGSTAVPFAEVLKEKFKNLTVITHSAGVFDILKGHENFTVILCGGHYMSSENAFFGALTLDMLDHLHMQKAFIFPSAVSLECGICEYQQELYQIQKKMMECADSVYILADSSKFEKRALLKLDDMKEEYFYITDSNLAKDKSQLYKESGRKVICEKVQEMA